MLRCISPLILRIIKIEAKWAIRPTTHLAKERPTLWRTPGPLRGRAAGLRLCVPPADFLATFQKYTNFWEPPNGGRIFVRRAVDRGVAFSFWRNLMAGGIKQGRWNATFLLKKFLLGQHGLEVDDASCNYIISLALKRFPSVRNSRHG